MLPRCSSFVGHVIKFNKYRKSAAGCRRIEELNEMVKNAFGRWRDSRISKSWLPYLLAAIELSQYTSAVSCEDILGHFNSNVIQFITTNQLVPLYESQSGQRRSMSGGAGESVSRTVKKVKSSNLRKRLFHEDTEFAHKETSPIKFAEDAIEIEMKDCATSTVTEDLQMPQKPEMKDCATSTVTEDAQIPKKPEMKDCATSTVTEDAQIPQKPGEGKLKTSQSTQGEPSVPDFIEKGLFNITYTPKDIVGKKKCAVRKPYRFCICKQKHTEEEEDNMLVCEATKKNCPGKGYFHMKCLGFDIIPKDSPWLCKDCNEAVKSSKLTRK
eukprot:Seg4505.1 transcript_id=Seg4505.1/GoldUCD/mRNA.D3Y31 product="hypothetical protein" protein_id=Seg4505.1/GoldUCD/D3Y31